MTGVQTCALPILSWCEGRERERESEREVKEVERPVRELSSRGYRVGVGGGWVGGLGVGG